MTLDDYDSGNFPLVDGDYPEFIWVDNDNEIDNKITAFDVYVEIKSKSIAPK